jgi:GNAT superfamily N-acetyltransferase
MDATQRAYAAPDDYNRVSNLLRDTFRPAGPFGNWEPMRWEYCHHHSYFDAAQQHHMGLWEDEGELVAAVVYEMRLGDAYFQIKQGYEHLQAEMLEWAERHLSVPSGEGRRRLRVFVAEHDPAFEALVAAEGYAKTGEWADPYARLEIPDPFPQVALPDGYRVKGLDEENNLAKINECLWYGFDHEGDPSPHVAGRADAQLAPNWRADLNIVAEAPDGSFASYAGLWYDDALKCAFVEPVATHPSYRRMGLGTAAVMEGVRRCAALGAEFAFVGSSQPFYQAMGFKVMSVRNPWARTL